MAMDNPDDLIPLISAKIKDLEPENASKIIEYLLLQEMTQAELLRLAFGPNSLIQEFCGKAKSEMGNLPSKGSSLNPNARPFNINDQSLSQSSQRNQFLDLSRTPTIPLSTSSIRNNPNSNSSLFHGGSSQFPFLNDNNPFPNLQTRSFSANHDRLESEQPRFWEIAQPQQQRMFAARGSPIQGSGQFGVEGGNSYSPGRHETEDINSRKIYLTFPLQSTFTDKDASTYFSKFGRVEEVWIPYQQQRMYGFVTFAKAKTVRTILARRNPHFICDSPVLVKRYKEKENILQNPGSDEREDINSRKIYLTFPPYSSFTDEDVSTYFSKFGSVVDVTIPYQKRRTFGFVTFAKAETVETILAQENPHYINPQYRRKSRVTVKPWMEKEEILQNSN